MVCEWWFKYRINRTKYPSWFSQKKLPAVHFLSQVLPAAHFNPKNLVCLAFFGKTILLNYFISVSSSVCRLIGIEFDSNSNTQWSQRHNLQRRQWRKCQLSNPLSGETSWDTNRTTPIQFQISFTNQHTSSYVTKSSQPLNCLYSSPFPRRFFAPPPEPLAQ